MTSQTNEEALEAAIEKTLTGHNPENIPGMGTALDPRQSPVEENAGVSLDSDHSYRGGKGYYIGSPNDFNARYAIDEKRFWHFLEATQKEELEKIQRSSDWKLKILERYDRMVKKYGILRILRKGLDVEDAKFTLLYQLPMASSSASVQENFEKNEFSVTR